MLLSVEAPADTVDATDVSVAEDVGVTDRIELMISDWF